MTILERIDRILIDEGATKYVSPRDLPDWVRRILKDKGIGKDVEVEISDNVRTSGNWHDANVMDIFLYDKGKIANQHAIGGLSVNDTGREAQVKRGFETRLSKDKMILITNTYPKGAKLYVHPDAFIKALEEPKQQLSNDEYMVLVITKGLKSSYMGRPLRKDTAEEYKIDYDMVKNQLISKGLLNRNGAINKHGRNAILDKFGQGSTDPSSIARKLGVK